MRQHPIAEFADRQVDLDTDSKRALYANLWQLYGSPPTDDQPSPYRGLIWLAAVLWSLSVWGLVGWWVWG